LEKGEPERTSAGKKLLKEYRTRRANEPIKTRAAERKKLRGSDKGESMKVGPDPSVMLGKVGPNEAWENKKEKFRGM